MNYKQIVLNRDTNSGLFFSEQCLPYDREDVGEYIFINTALIYDKSDSEVWKKKMIDKFNEETQQEILKLESVLNDLTLLRSSLI